MTAKLSKGASIYDDHQFLGFFPSSPPSVRKIFILFVRKFGVLFDPPLAPSVHRQICADVIHVNPPKQMAAATEREGEGSAEFIVIAPLLCQTAMQIADPAFAPE